MKYRVLVTRRDGFNEHYWKGRETGPDPSLIKRAEAVLRQTDSVQHINFLARHLASVVNTRAHDFFYNVPEQALLAIAERAYPLIQTSRLSHFFAFIWDCLYHSSPKWFCELAFRALTERPYDELVNKKVLGYITSMIEHTQDQSLLDKWRSRLETLSHPPSIVELDQYLELAIKLGIDNIEHYVQVIERWTKVIDDDTISYPESYSWHDFLRNVAKKLPVDVAYPIMNGLLQNPNPHVLRTALKSNFWIMHPELFVEHLPNLLEHPIRWVRSESKDIVKQLLLTAANKASDDERREALRWVETVKHNPTIVEIIRSYILEKRRWYPPEAEVLEPILSDYGIKVENEP